MSGWPLGCGRPGTVRPGLGFGTEVWGAMGGGGISMRCRARLVFVEPDGTGTRCPSASVTGVRDCSVCKTCDMPKVDESRGLARMTTYLLRKWAEWRPSHCAWSTFQGGCADTRSFAEVAEVTQRKICQEERCRAQQRPQMCVLSVYVWLRSDSFYQIRDDEGVFGEGYYPMRRARRRWCGPRGGLEEGSSRCDAPRWMCGRGHHQRR